MPSKDKPSSPDISQHSKNATQIYNYIFEANNHTRSQDLLFIAFSNIPGQELKDSINSLLNKGLLKLLQNDDKIIYYQAVTKDEAKLTSNLDISSRVVFNIIQAAGTNGIPKPIIRAKTNLHEHSVSKALRILQNKSLVNNYRSIKRPNEPRYIDSNLEPNEDQEGGPWFTNSVFDTVFVDALFKIVRQYLAKQTLTTSNRIPLLYPSKVIPLLPTSVDVLNYVKSTGAFNSNVKLRVQDIESVLNALISDKFCEKILVPAKESPHNTHDKHNYSKTSIEYEDKKKLNSGIKRKYSSVNQMYSYVYRCLPDSSRFLGMKPGLVDSPCGLCPQKDRCVNNGDPVILDSPPTLGIKTEPNEGWLQMKNISANDTLRADGRYWRLGDEANLSQKLRNDNNNPGILNPKNCIWLDQWLTW